MSGKKFTPDFWETAKTDLRKRDKTLKKIIDSYHGEMMVTRGDAFFTLARAITGQQISTKAADTIWGRLIKAAGSMKPDIIANMDALTLRSCGLSERKVIYLHGLANHFLDNAKRIKQWPKLPDDELIKELVALHGIGRWTAEMFMMFHLGRPDIFPLDDLGLLKGIYRHYNKSKPLTRKEVIALGETWRPWRSVATWYLWRALDPLPISY